MKQKEKIWEFQNPKYNSFRNIDIDSIMKEILTIEKNHQIRAREFYSDSFHNIYISDKRTTQANNSPLWMVNSRSDGIYINPRVTQHLGRIIHYKLGLESFDFHSLRHTRHKFTRVWR